MIGLCGETAALEPRFVAAGDSCRDPGRPGETGQLDRMDAGVCLVGSNEAWRPLASRGTDSIEFLDEDLGLLRGRPLYGETLLARDDCSDSLREFRPDFSVARRDDHDSETYDRNHDPAIGMRSDSDISLTLVVGEDIGDKCHLPFARRETLGQ